MPAPGDQHRATNVLANPFEELTPRINEYTAREIATLQARLDRQLGPEYISTRPGNGGGKVHYLAAEKVINLANEVFGFNGWSSQIKDVHIDFVDESADKRISLGLHIICRVSLRDGTFHEDIGYGHIENCKGKAAAFEKAKKEAATDAMKRALRNFGNLLGNCLYDKDYLQRVTKVKINPTKWDADNLHRHPDFAPVKQESVDPNANTAPQQNSANGRREPNSSNDGDDDFGEGNLFDEMELNPDEVMLYGNESQRPSKGLPPHPAHQPKPFPQSGHHVSGPPPPPSNTHRPAPHMPPPAQPERQTNASSNFSTPPNLDPALVDQRQTQQETPDISTLNAPVGFVTSRALAKEPSGTNGDPIPPSVVASLPKFDPKRESPSIRKTVGVNHNTSKPVPRQAIAGQTAAPAGPPRPASPAPPPPNPTTNAAAVSRANGPNVLNPALDPARRIGMPGGAGAGAGSPLANRGAYKPPGPAAAAAGVKRPLPGGGESPGRRAPLADVSNVSGPGVTGGNVASNNPANLAHASEDVVKRTRRSENA